MKTKILILVIALGSVFTFSSCGKKGCVDVDAKNYCDECKKEDGSCTYEGKIVFWNNQSTSTFLVGDGAVTLTYYVDGSLVGSSAASVYWSGAPNCGQSVSVTKDLGKNKSKTSTYSVKDQTGFEYYSGSVTFSANTCTSYQLQ